MDKSETIACLAASLSSAQSLIQGAVKDKTNPFFRSKYADLGAVVDAIQDPITKNGLSFVQIVHDKKNSAAIETIILHSSGEWISCGIVSVPVSKEDAQGYGSALTYARRYSLSAAFGVAPEDDDGNAASKAKIDQSKKQHHDKLDIEAYSKALKETKNKEEAENIMNKGIMIAKKRNDFEGEKEAKILGQNRINEFKS